VIRQSGEAAPQSIGFAHVPPKQRLIIELLFSFFAPKIDKCRCFREDAWNSTGKQLS
jgi:hypothetical protein